MEELFLKVKKIKENATNTKRIAKKYPPNKNLFKCCISIDKQQYRPGETLLCRIILLNAFTGMPKIKNHYNEELVFYTFVIYDQSNTQKLRQTVSFPQDSVISFSIDIPESFSGGEYNLEVFALTVSEDILPIINALLNNDSDDLIDSLEKRAVFPPTRRRFEVVTSKEDRIFNMELQFQRKGMGQGDKVICHYYVSKVNGDNLKNLEAQAVAVVDGKEVFRKIYSIPDGSNADEVIEFKLPESIEYGVGTLTVKINDGVTESISKTIPIILREVDCEIFPEGGKLTSNIANGVYFECRTKYGDITDMKANLIEIEDEGKKKKIIKKDIKSYHEGRGVFYFTPNHGKTYNLEVLEPKGITVPIKLPQSTKDGVYFKIKEIKDKIITASIVSDIKRKVSIMVYQKHVNVNKQVDILLEALKEMDVMINIGEYCGVLRVTIIDEESKKPLFERLVYIKPKKTLNFIVESNKNVYIPGETVELNINCDNNDSDLYLCCTVVDDGSVKKIERRKRHPMLLQQFYLEDEVKTLYDSLMLFKDTTPGEFKGEIDPNLGIDLLLGTQGWRRFIFYKFSKDNYKLIDDENDFDMKNAKIRVLSLEDIDKGIEFKNIIAKLLELMVNIKYNEEKKNKIDDEIDSLREKIYNLKGKKDKIEFEKKVDIIKEINETMSKFTKNDLDRLKTEPIDLYKTINTLRETEKIANEITEDLSRQNKKIMKANTSIDRAYKHQKTFKISPELEKYKMEIINNTKDKKTDDVYSKVNDEQEQRKIEISSNIPEGEKKLEYVIPEKEEKKKEKLQNKMEKVRKEINEIKSSMQENLDVIINRGNDLESLMEKADVLEKNSIDFGFNQSFRKRFNPFNRDNDESYQRRTLTEEEKKEMISIEKEIESIKKKKKEKKIEIEALKEEKEIMEEKAEEYSKYFENSIAFQREYSNLKERIKRREIDENLETVFYSPVEKVKEKNKMVYKFKAEKFSTSYRVFVDGFTNNGVLGSSNSFVIKSTEKYFFNVKIPEFITLEDKVKFPIFVRNNGTKEKVFKIRIDFEKDVFSLSKAIFKMTVKANETACEYLEIIPKKLSKPRKITFYLNYVDVERKARISKDITKMVGILSNGWKKVISQSLQINKVSKQEIKFSLPQEIFPDTLKSTVTVLPSVSAELMDTFNSMIKQPTGCFEQTSSVLFPLTMAAQIFQETNQRVSKDVMQKIDLYLNTGYKKIESFQEKDGGFSLFGNGFSSVHLTSLGIRLLTEMKKIYNVNDGVISRANDWLMSKKKIIREKQFRAYMVYSMSFVCNKMEKFQEDIIVLENGNNNLYIDAFLALSYYNFENLSKSEKIVMEKIIPAQNEDGSFDFEGSTITFSGGKSKYVETTALCTLALLNFKEKYWIQSQKGIFYLYSCRNEKGFGNTQSTCLAIQAIVKYYEFFKNINASDLLLKVNGKEIQVSNNETFSMKNEKIADLMEIGKENSIEINNKGENNVPLKFYAEMRTKKEEKDEEKIPFIFSCKPREKNIKESELLEIEISLENKENYELPMIVAQISNHTGIQLRTEKLSELKNEGCFSYWEMPSQRELVLYWENLSAGSKKTFKIEGKALFQGEFKNSFSRAYLYYEEEKMLYVDPFKVIVEK